MDACPPKKGTCSKGNLIFSPSIFSGVRSSTEFRYVLQNPSPFGGVFVDFFWLGP